MSINKSISTETVGKAFFFLLIIDSSFHGFMIIIYAYI